MIQGASNTLTLKRLVTAGMITSVPPSALSMRLELSFDVSIPTDDEFGAICCFNEHNLPEDKFKMEKFVHVFMTNEWAKAGTLVSDVDTSGNGILDMRSKNDSMSFSGIDFFIQKKSQSTNAL
jgi:hypothetical protein